MVLPVLFLLVGLVALIVGSDVAIVAASRVARQLGLSELIVGMTVVAIGTSLPELATTLAGSLASSGGTDAASGVAVGNILGSNIFMLTFLLGVSALVQDLPVNEVALRRDGGTLIGFTLLLVWPFAMGWAGRAFGAVAVLLFVAFMGWLVLEVRRSMGTVAEGAGDGNDVDGADVDVAEEVEVTEAPTFLESLVGRLPIPGWLQQGLLVVGGLGVVVGGATLVVRNGVDLAEQLAISATLIGIFVGATTSLPEVVVSVRAASKGSTDLAVGNILGSSITNLGLCLGLPVLVAPIPVGTDVLKVDYPFLVASTLIALFLMAERDDLTKREGAGLLVLFALYLAVRMGLA